MQWLWLYQVLPGEPYSTFHMNRTSCVCSNSTHLTLWMLGNDAVIDCWLPDFSRPNCWTETNIYSLICLFVYCIALMMWLCGLTINRKRSSGELSESPESTMSPDPDNLLGRRIQHTWREKGNVTKWKGTVLERLTVNSSLYMVKYDGFDCVYGIELFKDNRVSNLQVLSEKVGECNDFIFWHSVIFFFPISFFSLLCALLICPTVILLVFQWF